MPDDFLIARNPDEDSTLPYLLRLPLGSAGVVLKARDTWPRTSKIYCHRADEWPADPELVERVAVRACTRHGAAIDLVLDRGRENRSQFVLTRIRGGREAIFWQTARTARQARPNVGVPRARASGVEGLEIVIDSHERYPYRFAQQQVTTRRAGLSAGDYGVLAEGRLVASVERKSLADLVSTLTGGRLGYALGELAALPRAGLVVEDRYSRVFALKHVRPALVADGLAEVQVRWPGVPIFFAETRRLAEEWTYRFLAAAWIAVAEDAAAGALVEDLPAAGPVVPAAATPSMVRRWATTHGYAVSDRGRVPRSVMEAYARAQQRNPIGDPTGRGG